MYFGPLNNDVRQSGGWYSMARYTLKLIPVLCLLASPALAREFIVDGTAANAIDTGPGTAASPFKTIAHAADTAGPGDVITVRPGAYREAVRLHISGLPGRPIIYQAEQPGSVLISGADPITGWQKMPGDAPIYRAPWDHIFAIDYHNGVPVEHHPEDAPLWGRAEQVISDGRQLLPAAGLVGLRDAWKALSARSAGTRPATVPPPLPHLGGPFGGQFAVDTTRKEMYVWLADGSDPNGHRMEAATRSQTFGTNPWENKEGVSNIVVRGFVFRYGASFPQRAVVWLHGHDNLLEDSVVDQMSGAGVAVAGTMRRCLVQGCGQCGGAAGGTGFLNEDCSWIGNCWKPIDRGWDAGGVKMAVVHDGAFRRCTFFHNGGPGLWFDIDVHNVTIANCLFEGNEGSGLFIEISRDITVVHNLALRNGVGVVGATGGPDWSTGGIQLGESEDCVVAYNTCVENKDGITLREQGPRPLDTDDAGKIPYHNRGHIIVGNVCAFNKGYQLGLWYDNGFFGWHPADKKTYGTEAAYDAHLKAHPDQVYDPVRQDLVIDRNLYYPGPGESVALYGVPWRPKFTAYPKLADFSAKTGFDLHSQVANPGFLDPTGGDYRFKPGSPAVVLGAGANFPAGSRWKPPYAVADAGGATRRQ